MGQEMYTFFAAHIHPIQEPRQWLPIMVLAYSILEGKNLVAFWREKAGHPQQRLLPQQLERRLLVSYRWRTISTMFLSLLLGACIVVSLGLHQ